MTIAAAVTAAVTFPPTAGADPALPHSVVAIGDSITSAWGSGSATAGGGVNVPGDNPSSSWATGSDPAVRSHVQRLAEAGAQVTAVNLALPGRKATSSDGVVWQATQVPAGTDAVLVETGSADLCAADVTSASALTPVDVFQAQIDAMLREIVSRLPDAHILIASIPDWYRVWQAQPAVARPVDTCPMLFSTDPLIANATSRDALRQRNADYNAAIVRACAGYGTCRTDGGAVYGIAFGPGDLSDVDHFHFNVSGQAKIAAVTWPAGWYAGSGPAQVSVVHENADVFTLAVDRAGAAYGLSTLPDDPAGDYRLYRSTDEGRNWRPVFDFPVDTDVVAMSAISSGTLFAHVLEPGGYFLYRSADGGFSWSKVFAFPAGYSTLSAHSITDAVAADSRSVYVASYIPGESAGDSINYVWRSDDDGLTWSVVHQTTSHRHAHFVQVNPYDGAVYVGYGDSDAQSAIERSTDRGVTWQPVCSGSICTAVDIAFDPSGFAIFGQDRPSTLSRIARLDLATGTPISVGALPGPSYSALALGGGLWLLGETHEPGASDDGRVHLFASNDNARSFNDVLTRPVADPSLYQLLRVQFSYGNGDFPVQVWGYGTIVGRFGGTGSAPEWRASPTITGDARQGQALTASNGDWGGNPTGYAYQWRRCDVARYLCADILGASGQTYTPTAADVGSAIRVRVTASSAGGTSVATSLATSPVVATRDFSITLLRTSGTVVQGSAFETSVTVTGTGGFTDAVRLTVTGLPYGVRAYIYPSYVYGAGVVRLLIQADRYATRGTVNVTVAGASGALLHQATLVLSVAAQNQHGGWFGGSHGGSHGGSYGGSYGGWFGGFFGGFRRHT